MASPSTSTANGSTSARVSSPTNESAFSGHSIRSGVATSARLAPTIAHNKKVVTSPRMSGLFYSCCSECVCYASVRPPAVSASAWRAIWSFSVSGTSEGHNDVPRATLSASARSKKGPKASSLKLISCIHCALYLGGLSSPPLDEQPPLENVPNPVHFWLACSTFATECRQSARAVAHAVPVPAAPLPVQIPTAICKTSCHVT